MSKRKKRRVAPPPGALCSLRRLRLLIKRGHKHPNIKIHAVSTYIRGIYNIDLDHTTSLSTSRWDSQVLCSGGSFRADLRIYNVTGWHSSQCYLFENYWLALAYLIRVKKGEVKIAEPKNR